MSKRNSLFRKAKQLLEKEGHPESKAIEIAYNSLIRARQDRSTTEFTGSGETPGSSPIAVVEDICLGTVLDALSCTEEEVNPFRKLDGRCNNVGFETPKGREFIELMLEFNITNIIYIYYSNSVVTFINEYKIFYRLSVHNGI